MSRLIFALLGFGCFIGAIAMHSSLFYFINLPSVIIVVVPGFALTCAAHGLGGLMEAIKAGLRADAAANPDAAQHQIVLQTLRNTLCGAGVVGSLLGFTMMLASMEDPSRIGPAMAVALLSALYAVVLAELMVAPMIQGLKAPASDSNLPSDGARGALTSVLLLFGTTAIFMVMLNSMHSLST